MPDSTVVLLLSTDSGATHLLQEVARGLGGVDLRPAEPEEIPTGGWEVLVIDAEHPGATGEGLGAWKTANPGAAVAWLTRFPRADAGEALERGADDVWVHPLEPAETRARLGTLLELTKLRRPGKACGGRATPSAGARMGGKQTPHTRDLQILLDAQEALLAARAPGQLEAVVRETLRELFPDGATACARTEGRAEAGREVQGDGPSGWTRAIVPIGSGDHRRWALRADAPLGCAYPRRKLDLLDLFASQVGQAAQRIHLYQALSEGKAEWERTFDTIRDTIAIVGPDLVIRRANWALATAAGLTPRELVGRRCHEALEGRAEPCAGCPVPRALSGGREARAEREVERRGKVFDYRAFPLCDEDGRPRAAIVCARDVTRQEQLERELRHSDRLVTVGQIAAGIAHEINNPLTAVSSYAQLLQMKGDEPRVVESASRIQEGVDRIHRIVRNLTSFVRPADEGHYPVDLNEVVADVLSFARYEITRGETQLVEDLQSPLPRVLGAKPQLEHVVVNLLTNARDAVAGRGTVTVRTRPQDARVLLEVADDGVGMPPEVQERIFEPFYTTKPQGHGTGLGLFVAAGIVQKHGGSLALASSPGRGSCFTLSLPAFIS